MLTTIKGRMRLSWGVGMLSMLALAGLNIALLHMVAEAGGGAEAERILKMATTVAIGIGVATVVGVVIGALYFEGLVITALSKMSVTMRKLAAGEAVAEIPGAERRDEIGDMAASVVVFRENAEARARLEAEAEASRGELDRRLAAAESAFEQASRDQKVLVDAMARELSKLARGDLSARVAVEVAPEYRQLKADFNAAIAQLEGAIGSIATAAGEIRSGSREISTAVDDLSHRTERQAASLQETAAALDEITATVKRTAAGARQANGSVAQAQTEAQRSGQVVSEAVTAMGAIASSAQEISKIIGVIDEIAFQTNLLALNAGVEAARAGDSGRGFAVVASEVRALAQRSADAAKEIKGLIDASGQQVQSGVELVGQTGEALSGIVGKVAEISHVIAEIAASAEQQSVGLAQVNTAINEMDKVTQQNAAMVEEANAATRTLDQHAAHLAESVDRFQLSGAPTNPVHAQQARLAALAGGRG
ncbi:MAG: hypothetical protein A2882_05895 [Phenylobacterium sp. RIFCSPHIGHO2_01_FULL_70_10]|nr:MAG: hypothetical protein A2882_05895 [Phenylobacterium sp. RIFCSPHIGHO2_01_FULL_70_10]